MKTVRSRPPPTPSVPWPARPAVNSGGPWPLVAGGTAVAMVIVAAALNDVLPYALAAGTLVPVVVALVKRPQRGILVLAALAPLDGLIPLVSTSRVVPYWKEGLVVAVVAATLVNRKARQKDSSFRKAFWFEGLAGLLVVALLSTLVRHDSQAFFGLKLDFFYVLVAWSVWRCPFSRVDRDRLVTIIMVTGLIGATYGLLQQVLGGFRLHALGYQYNSTITFNGGFLKSFGTFGGPHGLGFYEMFVILFGLSVALTDRRRMRNRAFLVLLPINLLGLAFSFTRGALVGLAVGILYLGLRRHQAILLCIPVALVALLLVPAGFRGSTLSATSAQQRASTWTNVPHIVADHPLGAGIGTTGSAVDKAQLASTPDTPSGLTRSTNSPNASVTVALALPDNYFVQTLAELGVAGLWLACLLLAGILVGLYRASEARAGPTRAFLDGAVVMVLAAVASSVTATYFSLFPMDLFFWLVVGVATATVSDERETDPSGTGLIRQIRSPAISS